MRDIPTSHVSNQQIWMDSLKDDAFPAILQQCFVGSSEHRYITIRWFMTLVAMARVKNGIIIPATKIVYNLNGALNQGIFLVPAPGGRAYIPRGGGNIYLVYAWYIPLSLG